MNNSLTENLKIFEEFVLSSDYEDIVVVAKDDHSVSDFLDHIMLRYESVKFFIDRDENRAIYESHLLASMICDYLGYEQ